MSLPNSAHWLSALEVGTGIARTEFSSLEMTTAMHQRIEDLDSRYRAYTAVMADRTLTQAKALENLSPQSRVRPSASRASISRALAEIRHVTGEGLLGDLPVSESAIEVASTCGSGSAETMQRGFQQSLGVSPSEYRTRFTRPTAA